MTSRFALHTLLAKAELAGVIDGAGSPGLLSPRALLGTATAAAAPSGVLRAAADVLRDPRTRITLRIWGGEEASAETTVLFPADPVAGGGYLLNDRDGGFELSGPIDAEQILALVAPMLPPAAPTVPFVAQLDPTTMAVLAAVVDMVCDDVRHNRIARVLDRRPLPDDLLADQQPFAPQRLAGYLEAWWALSRFDQLLTYAVALGGQSRLPEPPAIQAALAQLVEARLIAIDDTMHIAATPALAPLVEAAFGLSAGLQWQRVRRLDDGALAIDERIVLPCAGGRTLEVSVTAAGLVRLARIGREDVEAFLIAELSGPSVATGPSPGAQPPTTTVNRIVARSVATLPSQAAPARHFCQNCGRPVAAADRFCGECGAALT